MAGRYAIALFDLAAETKAIDAVKTDLEAFDRLVAEVGDLDRLVRSPVFSADEQLHALSAVLDRAGIGGLAAKFLKLVTAKRRLFAARDMIKGFRELVAKQKGEATAEVTVAEQLKDEHIEALRAALKAVSGKDVDLEIKIDPAIIGGLVVKLGSRMVDTSLAQAQRDQARDERGPCGRCANWRAARTASWTTSASHAGTSIASRARQRRADAPADQEPGRSAQAAKAPDVT